MIDLPALEEENILFPSPLTALDKPNGLLAIGGDLSPVRLVEAYRRGIFPWFGDDEPILWWSPQPRALITPQSLHISRSMNRFLKKCPYSMTWNTHFHDVLQACAAPRAASNGTWITKEMQEAYNHLHSLGIAHSIEIWNGEALVGGLYGLCLGNYFFGESMFSRETNTSKLALITLVQELQPKGLEFLDCQMMTPHLKSIGAYECDRITFLHYLKSLQSVTLSRNITDDQLQQQDMIQNSVLNIYLGTQNRYK